MPSMSLENIFSLKSLKVVMLVYSILFILISYKGLPPEMSSDFSKNLLAVIVEILVGTFIVFAVVDELIKQNNAEKWFIILLTEHMRVAELSYFIVFMSLSSFIPVIGLNDRNRMSAILKRMTPTAIEIPARNTLDAMWDGFNLWEELFFRAGTIEPIEDHPEVVSRIFKEIERSINLLKKINMRLEKTAVEEDQLMVVYGFEVACEVLDAAIEDFSAKRKANLMSALNSLLGVCIHLYSFTVIYYERLPKVENVEVHKYGFRFTIRKMKWWL